MTKARRGIMKEVRRFHCRAESVAGARHFVRDALSEEPREIVEAAELMTSELATNCVRHAHSDFELAISRSREEIRVEVSDHGEGQPVMRSPTPREQSGRGLRIVQELAEAWGTIPSPHGKLVWFTLPARTQAGERKSRSSASREQAPGHGHQPDRSHEPKQSHAADQGSHGAASSYVDLVEEHGKRGPVTAPGLEAMVLGLCGESVSAVELDLSRLTFMDSTGLRAVLRAQELCAEHGYDFLVIPGSGQVQRLLELTGTTDVLPLADAHPAEADQRDEPQPNEPDQP